MKFQFYEQELGRSESQAYLHSNVISAFLGFVTLDYVTLGLKYLVQALVLLIGKMKVMILDCKIMPHPELDGVEDLSK